MQIETTKFFIVDTSFAINIEELAVKYLIPTPITELPYKIPIVGLAIIEVMIDKILLENSEWTRLKSNRCTYQDIWHPFICNEYKNTVEVYDFIQDMLFELRNQITEFIGKDKWIMHFKKKVRNDLWIEKTIDYRIYSWHKEHSWEYCTKKPNGV